MRNLELAKACLYHPTKVVFLDDNQGFLDALELEFGDQKNMMMFTCPDMAMSAINNREECILRKIFSGKEGINDDTANHVGGFEVHNIVNIIDDATRFDNVSVLVVDYEMPTINGVEFCRKLEDKNIFKILLTAEADTTTAIDAFNSGLIDKFILKTSDNLHEKIMDSILELKTKYFNELSEIIIQSCGKSIKLLLNNDPYKNIFNYVLSTSQAKEYYLVDKYGSFLFLDKNAIPTWLIISDKNKIDDQVGLLEVLDFPLDIIDKIKNKNSVLFLFSDKEYKEQVSSWEKYIFESIKLDDNYHYSIINGRITDSIDWDSIGSYASNQ